MEHCAVQVVQRGAKEVARIIDTRFLSQMVPLKHRPLKQSVSMLHFSPAAHGWQIDPPQSISVSFAPTIPSLQAGIVGAIVGNLVGSCVGNLVGVGVGTKVVGARVGVVVG